MFRFENEVVARICNVLVCLVGIVWTVWKALHFTSPDGSVVVPLMLLITAVFLAFTTIMILAGPEESIGR